MEQNVTSSNASNTTTSGKKKRVSKKKKQQQGSGQQDELASRPSTSSGGGEEMEDENKVGKSEIQGDGGNSSSTKAMKNGKLATNGRANKNVNSDNSDGDEVCGLRDELEKEKARFQVLERQLASLRKDLIEKSKYVEAALSAKQEELFEVKSRSQELEKTVLGLKSELTQKPLSPIKDATVQEKLQELEEQIFAQRKEAAKLRELLGDERNDRENERAAANGRLAKAQEEKQQLDTQYKTLLGRVAHIRATLGDKLKSDAEELDRTRGMMESLGEENRSLSQNVLELQNELAKSEEGGGRASQDLSTLRNRMSISQQNWAKERNDLINAEKFMREECEAAKQVMQEWEVIATEERAVRESLGDRVIDLEEQLANQQAAYDKVLSERDRELNTVNGLQRALQDIQNARKIELREVVEGMEAEINQLTLKAQMLEKRAKDAEAQLLSVQQGLERVLPFEKEVKEKNLLIGKLRHEGVTLNDHLRKALRMLKRDNVDDKIDKQFVTNIFLQFVSIQRGDSKKYEILQLIASVLDWNDEQREKAGLVRPGTASNPQNSFLKTPPLSPFHRSPSTPTLSDAYEGSRDLWTSILDAEKS